MITIEVHDAAFERVSRKVPSPEGTAELYSRNRLDGFLSHVRKESVSDVARQVARNGCGNR